MMFSHNFDLSLDFLLEDDAFFSTRHFCTRFSMQSSFLQNELDALFDGDILSILDGREKQEQKLESQKAMELQCPSGHGSGEKTLTFELVSQYFCMPIKQAAQELTVGLTLLKSRCRALGIPRWPYRKVKSLQALIRNVQELATETGQDEKMTMNTVEMLQQTKKLMEQSPDVELDHWTKSLRQACFKENYKRRRLLAVEG